jgi:hypothetical protein
MTDAIHTDALAGGPPPSVVALDAGTLVGRFEIVRALSATDFGIEYRAVDRARGTEVVLREYLPRRLASRAGAAVQALSASCAEALSHGLAAFRDEARTLMQIEHPSLLRVIDVIEANDTAYQVMLHRGGTSLRQLRPQRCEPPDEASLRALLDAVLGALEALHRSGIAHGALTPDTILLMARDQPLLLGPDPTRADIAPALIEPLMTDVERAFAAPELLAPSPTRAIGPWTDLYGLAATLRFWIGGEWPGPREKTAAMVTRCCVGAHYSPQLLAALDLALSPEPIARPESVAQFRRALGARPSTPRFADRRVMPPAHATALRDDAANPALPEWELPLEVFLRGTRHGAPVAPMAPTPAPRRLRQRSTWAGGGAALLVAASCAAWQFGDLQTPGSRSVPSTGAIVPAPLAITDAPKRAAPPFSAVADMAPAARNQNSDARGN